MPVLQKQHIKLPFSLKKPTFSSQEGYLAETTTSKNSISGVEEKSLCPLMLMSVSNCVWTHYLALVEVINYLLVEMVLKLSLSGGLVAVSLCQVGCTCLI